MVLRQLDGSATNFLWGWDPKRPPGSSDQALQVFFRGLVFATLSDGKGLVEGLNDEFVEHYLSQHPIIAWSQCRAADDAPDAASEATVAKNVPHCPAVEGAG